MTAYIEPRKLRKFPIYEIIHKYSNPSFHMSPPVDAPTDERL